MTLPLYAAMTAGEFSSMPSILQRPAWMACHFSSYGTGLTNLPRQMPQKAMLIINDRTPVGGHDAGLIKEQLIQLINRFPIDRILLDLQRPDSPETADIAKTLVQGLPCPVGITEAYAENLDCPIFIEHPPHTPLHTAISRWKGRELWLEAALDAEVITVTATGSQFTPLPRAYWKEGCHQEADLCCHYQICVTSQQAKFTLFRTPEDLASLLEKAESLGFTCAVGLYQQLQDISVLE